VHSATVDIGEETGNVWRPMKWPSAYPIALKPGKVARICNNRANGLLLQNKCCQTVSPITDVGLQTVNHIDSQIVGGTQTHCALR
jgi:hypothetical protein